MCFLMSFKSLEISFKGLKIRSLSKTHAPEKIATHKGIVASMKEKKSSFIVS